MSNLVNISLENSVLKVEMDICGEVFKNHTILTPDVQQANPLILNWLMKSMKPFFGKMPLEDVEISCNEELAERFDSVINSALTTLYQTNEFIKTCEEGCAKDFNGVLFFNCADDIRYRAFYEFLRETNPDIKYLNLELGFDRVKRKWNKSPDPIPLEELYAYLIENKIKKIFTINHYVLDRYMTFCGVNLITVCDYIGIEWINIDHDPPDLTAPGYLHKAFLSSDKVKRFSCKSILQKPFDKRYGINCHYVAIPQNYNGYRPHKLDNDYDIVVLSNSRWNDVEPLKGVITELLDMLPQETLFKDLHLWYLSLRNRVLNSKLTEFQQLQVSTSLHTVMYMARNYLKYLIINALDTDREVKVYGDEGWKNVCPEYYQKSLNNKEIEKLYSETNHLYLLMNFSYSYLDASGPVYDVINQGIPFINVSPVFRTPILDKMRYVEYEDPVEMNNLINNYHNYYEYSLEGIDTYRDILASSAEDIRSSLSGGFPNGIFTMYLKEHEQLADEMVAEYTRKNSALLDTTYKRFVG